MRECNSRELLEDDTTRIPCNEKDIRRSFGMLHYELMISVSFIRFIKLFIILILELRALCAFEK